VGEGRDFASEIFADDRSGAFLYPVLVPCPILQRGAPSVHTHSPPPKEKALILHWIKALMQVPSDIAESPLQISSGRKHE